MKIPMMDREEFMALPANERRVMIAKDVLTLLRSSRVDVTQFGYLTVIGVRESESTKDVELQTLLRQRGTQCHVCAIGAIFVAEVMRCDNFVVSVKSSGYVSAPTDMTILPHLKDTFDSTTLRHIEAFFEGSCSIIRRMLSRPQLADLTERVRAFCDTHPMKPQRLKAICENIIENNGEFTL